MRAEITSMPNLAGTTVAGTDNVVIQDVSDSGNLKTVAAQSIANLSAGVVESWTPTLTFATPGDLSVTYTTRAGTLTKIGNIALVSCDIETDEFTHTTSSGALQITGLPYTASALAVGQVEFQGINKDGNINLLLGQSSDVFTFSASQNNADISLVVATDMV